MDVDWTRPGSGPDRHLQPPGPLSRVWSAFPSSGSRPAMRGRDRPHPAPGEAATRQHVAPHRPPLAGHGGHRRVPSRRNRRSLSAPRAGQRHRPGPPSWSVRFENCVAPTTFCAPQRLSRRGRARPQDQVTAPVPGATAVEYIDSHRDRVVEGSPLGVEPICRVLWEAGVQIARAPTTPPRRGRRAPGRFGMPP
jgi:hypothetical protein